MDRAPLIIPELDDARVVFVSPAGAPRNPGTRAAPLASVGEAAAQAQREHKVVCVAEGIYIEAVTTSVSMFGGYTTDFRYVDPDRYVSEIRGPATEPSIALTIEEGELTIQGFVLRGGYASNATAVFMHAASRATLVRNIIVGGGSGPEAGTSRAIDHRSGHVTLRDNVIHGGRNRSCYTVDELQPEGNTIIASRAQPDRLYQAVCEQPERDAPRRRYAEHLEAEGDELGEFIRLRLADKRGQHAPYSPRGSELLARLAHRIQAPLRPWARWCHLDRGLVGCVGIEARMFLDAGEELFSLAPILHLDLIDAKPVFEELMASPLLARIKTLGLRTAGLGDREAALLAASPHVRSLVWLSLAGNDIGQPGLEAITASPNLAGLQWLGFQANAVDDPVSTYADDWYADGVLEQGGGEIQRLLVERYGEKAWMKPGPFPPDRFELCLAND